MAPRKLDDLPQPPASLVRQSLPIYTLSETLYRIHQRANDPAFWGRTGNNRFDAPAGQFGLLYAAQQFNGAFIETFGDIVPHTVSVNSLTVRSVAHVQTARPLHLVDLAGSGLSQLGLDARICTGDHAMAQQWSLALWNHPQQVDGIWYVARHDGNERSVALFERAATAVTFTPRGGLLDPPNQSDTAAALDLYGFALLP